MADLVTAVELVVVAGAANIAIANTYIIVIVFKCNCGILDTQRLMIMNIMPSSTTLKFVR